MKKADLNFLYKYIKEQCAELPYKNNGEVRAVMLSGIYKAAFEYVKAGGKRDVTSIIDNATKIRK